MKGSLARAAVAGSAAAFACGATAAGAAAQETTVVPQGTAVTAPAAETTGGYAGPNRALLGTGFVTFAAAYIPAVAVAAGSDLHEDHHLYVPVAGPWLDLANRPMCAANSPACDNETTNKVLLGVDGAFQGIGALTTLAGFLAPENGTGTMTTTAAAEKPSVRLSPARMGAGGYGVTAFGDF
jgi:hypothetical protein